MSGSLIQKLQQEFTGTVSVTTFNYRTNKVLVSSDISSGSSMPSSSFDEVMEIVNSICSEEKIEKSQECISVWEEQGILRAYKLISENEHTAMEVIVNSDMINVGIFLRILSETNDQ